MPRTDDPQLDEERAGDALLDELRRQSLTATRRGPEGTRAAPFNFTVEHDETDLGLVAKRLVIEGIDPDKTPAWGINWSVLRHAPFKQLRADVRARADEFAARHGLEPGTVPPGATPATRSVIEDAISTATSRRPVGRPRTPDSRLAQWAEDYLAHCTQKSYRETLSDLPAWRDKDGVAAPLNTVDSRLRKLRKHRWLRGKGDAAQPGDRLITYRSQRTE